VNEVTGRVPSRGLIRLAVARTLLFLRVHGAFLAILAVAAVLRLWGLSWLPSPAGDEGNWTTYGQHVLRGESVSLDASAAFVSTLYAYLIAGLMAALGPDFLASRLVNAFAVLATVVVGYAVARQLASRRCALILSGVVAFHPWLVAYSRISSVPYGLAFAVETIGSLLFLLGVKTRKIAWVVAGILVLSAGAHFSPLAVVAPVACGVYLLARPQRWILRRWEVYAALAVGLAHAWPVVRSAVGMAGQAPDADQFSFPWMRVGIYLHMVVTGLGGEATLRHFTNAALSPWTALIVAVPVLGIGLTALSRRAREASPLAAFGLVFLAIGLLLTPPILAPARDWHLPATHMDRYLFSLLPGFVFCVAAVSAIQARAAAVAAVAWIAWLAVGDARMGMAFFLRNGVDRGEGVFDGGSGYRGWLVSDRSQPVSSQIRDEILRRVGPEGAALLVADRTFIPLRFVMDGTGIPVHDVGQMWIPPHPAGRYFILLWPDEVLSLASPPIDPSKYSTTDRGLRRAQRWHDRYRVVSERFVEFNRELRRRMELRFERKELVRTFRQPRGGPLLELWMAVQPTSSRLVTALAPAKPEER
jgi:hypothetical protein